MDKPLILGPQLLALNGDKIFPDMTPAFMDATRDIGEKIYALNKKGLYAVLTFDNGRQIRVGYVSMRHGALMRAYNHLSNDPSLETRPSRRTEYNFDLTHVVEIASAAALIP